MIVDAHVHFWDPEALHYPWLGDISSLQRAFLPPDYRTATGNVQVSKVVFVEANCRPDEALGEVELIERLAAAEPRIAGIVAFADVTDKAALGKTLDALVRRARVKGVRYNIQGHPAQFCVQPAFVDGVREVGRRGLTFDLCATHDQLGDVIQLVGLCPDTRFVLDHCGKPAIRDGDGSAWRQDIVMLAKRDNVCCKVSGLLTEAGPPPGGWSDDVLHPYAETVAQAFGLERLLYGSDWPVLTLAGSYSDWHGFTERFTAAWSPADRSGFYGDNAARVYDL